MSSEWVDLDGDYRREPDALLDAPTITMQTPYETDWCRECGHEGCACP